MRVHKTLRAACRRRLRSLTMRSKAPSAALVISSGMEQGPPSQAITRVLASSASIAQAAIEAVRGQTLAV